MAESENLATCADATSALRFAMQLAPRAQAQLDTFPDNLRELVRERLDQLALRGPGVAAPSVRGHLMGGTFHAVYEVDNERGTVTVIDVGVR